MHADFKKLVHVADEVREGHVGLVEEFVEVLAVEGKLAFVQLVGCHDDLGGGELSV